MSRRTDEELIKILTVDRQDYQPLAIEAAEKESKARNIPTEKIESLQSDFIKQLEEKTVFDAKKVSMLKRFVHLLVDTLACYLITIIVLFLIGPSLGSATLDTAFTCIIFLLCFFGYYVLMETKYKRTIGKFMTNSLVVTKHEDAPSTNSIMIRTFCRLVPFDALSFLITRDGLHDRFSNTTLINHKDDLPL